MKRNEMRYTSKSGLHGYVRRSSEHDVAEGERGREREGVDRIPKGKNSVAEETSLSRVAAELDPYPMFENTTQRLLRSRWKAKS